MWLSQRYSTTVSQAIGKVYRVLVSYPSPKKNKVKKSWQRYINLFISEKTFEISRFGIEVAEKNMSRTIQQATIQKKSSDKIKVKSILTHWIFSDAKQSIWIIDLDAYLDLKLDVYLP